MSDKEVCVGVYFVGCDQKHEEELDSEAVYKNFVLRVSIIFCFRFELELHNSLYFDMIIMSFAGHGSKKSQCKTQKNTKVYMQSFQLITFQFVFHNSVIGLIMIYPFIFICYVV